MQPDDLVVPAVAPDRPALVKGLTEVREGCVVQAVVSKDGAQDLVGRCTIGIEWIFDRRPHRSQTLEVGPDEVGAILAEHDPSELNR